MNPNPPISMRENMTTVPKPLQCAEVDTTVKPVTVAADVEVKNESSKGVNLLSALDIGRLNTRPPTVIRRIKP